MLDAIWQDFRYGLTQVYKRPKVSLVIIFCLALALGPNTAIFSLINAVMLAPPNVNEPQQLRMVYTEFPTNPGGMAVEGKLGDDPYYPTSLPNFLDMQDRVTAPAGLLGTEAADVVIDINGTPRDAYAHAVSNNFFDVLGVEPAVGEVFHTQPTFIPGGLPQIVLGYQYWQSAFNGDPEVIGQQTIINGNPTPFTIIGVAPESFTGIAKMIVPDMYVPMEMMGQLRPDEPNRMSDRRTQWMTVYAKVASPQQERATNEELDAFAAYLRETYPEIYHDVRFELQPYASLGMMPPGLISMLGMGLLAFVGTILLVACSSVAALLLARATERDNEICTRLALGATRGMIIRQLLIEGLVLAAIAAGVGWVMALWLLELAPALLERSPIPLPVTIPQQMDMRVLGYVALLVGVTTLISSLLPALHAVKHELVAGLKENAGQASGRRKTTRLRNGFIVVQFAVSVVLLIAAGLMLRSMLAASEVDPGFDYETLLVYDISPSRYGIYGAQAGELVDRLITEIEQVDGVEQVSAGRNAPFGLDITGLSVTPVMDDLSTGDAIRGNEYFSIAPEFFDTLGVDIVDGRDFTRADRDGAVPPVVINRAMATALWNSPDAVGRSVMIGSSSGRALEVVGVVENFSYRTLGDRQPLIFLPLRREFNHGLHFIIQTQGISPALQDNIVDAIGTVNPNFITSSLQPVESLMAIALLPTKIVASLCFILGGVALVLSLIGLYGVIAYSINQRQKDAGIRLAIGGNPVRIRWQLIKQGAVLVAAGMVIGLLLALGAAPLFKGILVDTSPFDLVVFVFVPLLMTVIAVAAILNPAFRITRTEPVSALRYE